MKKVLLIISLLTFVFSNSYSQYARGQMKEDFYNAESYVLFEEYKEALQFYQGLLRIDPRNSNYKYRIGQCLINIAGRKHEAVSYLEAAVKDINPDYKEGKFTETKAPYDAYYYLANAYRINNQLDKALATYELFKQNLDPKIYDTAVVSQQIISCKNAMELMKVPLYLKKENLGNLINSQYPDLNPVISGDQTVMVFNRMTPFQEALLYTRKVNSIWTEPRNIIPDLGFGQESGNYATSLSNDGRELYIYRRGDDYDGSIYVTKRTGDDQWSNIIKLNDNINTKYWESHACVSHDGKKLYFTSNRKDSYGGLDIYVSQRDSADAWGPAANLGNIINTIYNEESPFLGGDDKTLFFSSRGHFNIGGYDIHYSTFLENGQWSIPLNVGFPLNTTDEDIFFDPVEDGYKAYYAMIDSAGYGQSDIYMIEIFSKDHPRKFYIRGIAQIKDLINMFGDSIKISAFNAENPDTKVVVYTDPVTGEYKFEVPQGKYSITYEAENAEMAIKEINLPLTFPSDSLVLPGTTLPKTDIVADLNVGDIRNITVVKGDTIAFPLRVEPNSVLVVEHWLGDSLLYSEKFVITDSTFVYKTAPLAGNNRLVFKLTDKYNNKTTSEIFITRKRVVTDESVLRPEYRSVIVQKQLAAFADLFRRRSDSHLKQLIRKANIHKQLFTRPDDLIVYLRELGARNGIPAYEIDKVALKVAVMDNVLSQAAVDLLADNVEGELKGILKNLNIYDAGLKTWTDLQKYISDKSEGKISAEDLNRIAADILAGIDTSIAVIREKIVTYGKSYEKGPLVLQSVLFTDRKNIKKAGIWLRSYHDESIHQKLTENEIARMFSALSALPGTLPDRYIEDLAGYADEQLAGYLKGLDTKKNRIKRSDGLVLFLLRNRDKGQFTSESLFKALARIIAEKEIPEEIISSQALAAAKANRLFLWLIIGELLAFLLIILLIRRRKDKKKSEQ